MSTNFLVTGSAGFIGAAVTEELLLRGYSVVGMDNHNDYYSPFLKEQRLRRLNEFNQYQHFRVDISNATDVDRIFNEFSPLIVINMAAQAGVRYSFENPAAYALTNVSGFTNVITAAVKNGTQHFVYASSSSVYGGNTKLPFSETDEVNSPLSVYAATKRANELIAHAYSHAFGLPTTGLRFFTVYGPWGRPDMALFKFTRAIINGERIPVFNWGRHRRDFTYIDDIVQGVLASIQYPQLVAPSQGLQDPKVSPWRLFNLGSGTQVELMEYIRAIEMATGKKALIDMLPPQQGDVTDTFADISKAQKELRYNPQTSVDAGVAKFVDWFRTMETP